MLVQDRSRVVDEFGRRSWRTSSSDYNNNRGESKAIRAHILDDGIKICADVQSSASHRIVPRSIKTPHNGRLQEHSLGPKSERFRGTFCRDSANPGRDRSSEEEGAAVRPSVRTQQSSDLLLLVAPECTLFALGRKRGATNKFREPSISHLQVHIRAEPGLSTGAAFKVSVPISVASSTSTCGIPGEYI
jgi:hypothetical protein